MAFSFDRKSRDLRGRTVRDERGETPFPHDESNVRRTSEDPLAELARLVGSDDPFAVFNEPRRQEPQQSAEEGSYEQYDGTYVEEGGALRGTVDAHAPEYYDNRRQAGSEEEWREDGTYSGQDAHAGWQDDDQVAAPAEWRQDHAPAGERWDENEADDYDRFAEPYIGPQAGHESHPSTLGPTPSMHAEEHRRERRRGGFTLVAAVLGIALLGGGATLAYRAMVDPTMQGGPPPVIEADAEPVKLQPDDPGGSQVPHQNKTIYDRVAGDEPDVSQTQLAESESEPLVDLPGQGEAGDRDVSRIIMPGPADEAPSQGPAAQGGDPIEPRRVRTVVVRPDGTIVREQPSGTPPSQQVASLAGSSGTAADPEAADLAPGAAMSVPDASAADAFADDGAGQPPAEAAEETRDVPVPQGRPDDVSEQPEAAAPPQQLAAAPQAVAAAASAPWSVQVAAQRSEEQARSAYAGLQRRFAGVLGGQQAQIVRADLGERGVYYRVRLLSDSRGSADALCNSLKQAGGDCIVQRN